MKWNYSRGIILLLVTGSLFRFYGLEHESLANDELSSCYRSSFSSISSVVSEGVMPDVHPPGYQILIFFVKQGIGNSPAALRLPSAIAGVMCIYVLFILGRKLFSPSVGFLSAAFLTVSPVHIWYSQEARAYSILVLLVTMSVYLLVRMIQNLEKESNPGLSNTICFIAVNILMEYFHYLGLLMAVLASGAILLFTIFRRSGLKASVAVCIVSAAAFVPWIPAALKQSGSENYITTPGISSLQSLYYEYMSWSRVMQVLFAIIVPAALIVYRRRRSYAETIPLYGLTIVIMWIVLPILTALAISFLLVPIVTNRNLLVTLPAFFLLLSVSVHILLKSRLLRFLVGALILLLLAVQLLFIRKHYTRPHKSQFREVARFTAENVDPGSDYLIVASSWNEFYFDYYFQRYETGLSVDTLATMESEFSAVRYLIERRDPDAIWFIWGHREPEEALLDSMKKYSEEQEYFPFVFAGIWRFSL